MDQSSGQHFLSTPGPQASGGSADLPGGAGASDEPPGSVRVGPVPTGSSPPLHLAGLGQANLGRKMGTSLDELSRGLSHTTIG